MATTRNDIRQWAEEAKKGGATHMMVVCDTFNHDDYPVPVLPGDNVREVFAMYNKENMQRVIEVYALHVDLESQLNEERSFHFEYPGEVLRRG